jgi:drug/metabolite transporter (DMT)-like permease
MFAAVLTTLLFSLSAVFGRRLAQAMSATQANLGRLGMGALLLGVWAHLFGAGLRGPAFPTLFLSGCVGFGLGDLSMFQAYRRMGIRRTVVIIQCLAAPLGAAAEWIWLDRAPTMSQALFGSVILLGVTAALLPGASERRPTKATAIGACFGVMGALGQAGGAVLSRKAYAIAAEAGAPFFPTVHDGLNAAYQRMLGGIAVSAVAFVYVKVVVKQADSKKGEWRRGWPWMIAHALAGPVAGVSCFQWALMIEPTSVVLPIVATTPLVVLPLAALFDDEPITYLSVLGSAVAVGGVVGLVLCK